MTLSSFATGTMYLALTQDDMHGVERVLLAYMPIEAEGDAYPNRGAARPLRKECFLRKTLTPPSCSIVGQFQPNHATHYRRGAATDDGFSASCVMAFHRFD